MMHAAPPTQHGDDATVVGPGVRPYDSLVQCALRPDMRAALAAACAQAAAERARALLCFVRFGMNVGDRAPGDGADGFALLGVRLHDVVATCAAGLVVVAGPFHHPADTDSFARKLLRLTSGRRPMVAMAIFPNHGETPEALVASAACSVRRDDLTLAMVTPPADATALSPRVVADCVTFGGAPALVWPNANAHATSADVR